jgi:hypothetical protein
MLNNIILNQYDNGLSISEIAKQNNTNFRLIRKILIDNNREIRTNSFNSRRYSLNHEKFDTIDSEDKAYWLGFLFADGCVHENSNDISLSLSIVDIGHLEKFKTFLETDKPIRTYSKKVGSDYSKMIATSSHMKESLISLGCIPNKTTTLRFPNIRKDLVLHFIRGYFDGDGSITYASTQKSYKFRMCGTYEFLSSVKEILDIENPLRQRWPDRGVNNWEIDFGGNIKTYKKLKLLYENSTVYLDRKFERFCQLRSHHIEKYGLETL